MTLLRSTLAALALLAAPVAHAEVPMELLVGGCQGCHGVAGQGANAIPTIQHTRTRAEFIVMMREFRNNSVPNSVMGRIVRGYSEAEVTLLAAHFGKPE